MTDEETTIDRHAAAVAILAGGRAARFGGRDKASLVLGGQSILERQLAQVRTLRVRVFIVANDQERYGATGCPVVPDQVAGAGPLGGIYTALVHAGASRTLVLACDLPFVRSPLLEHLLHIAETEDVDAVVPRTEDGRHPLCAVYAATSLDAVRHAVERGRFKVVDAIATLRLRDVGPDDLARFDPDGIQLFNINTPDDYEAARDRLAGGTPRSFR